MAKHNATAIPCPQCACGELVREAGFASPSSPAITRCPCHTGGVEDVKQALKDFGYDDDVVDKIYSSKAKRAFSSAAALLKSMQNENLRGNIKDCLRAAGMEDFDVGLLEQSLLAEVEKHSVSEPAAKKPRQDDVPVGGGGGGGPAAAVRPVQQKQHPEEMQLTVGAPTMLDGASPPNSKVCSPTHAAFPAAVCDEKAHACVPGTANFSH